MLNSMTYLSVLCFMLIIVSTSSTLPGSTGVSIQALLKGIPPYGGAGGCPLCDTSVYSYCSHKIHHDACCCNPPPLPPPHAIGGGFGPIGIPPPIGAPPINFCQTTNCVFLHANTCYEHSLIVSCCCNSPF